MEIKYFKETGGICFKMYHKNNTNWKDQDLSSNPALLFSAVNPGEGIKAVYPLNLKQRDIAGLAGFPPTDQSVKILSKVRPEDCSVNTIETLKAALNHSDKFRKLLSHMPFLTADIISIFKPEYERYLNGRLLLSLLNGYEWNKNPLICFDIVKDAVEAMIETIKTAPLCNISAEGLNFRSICDIFELNCEISDRYRLLKTLSEKKPFPETLLKDITFINIVPVSNSFDLFIEGSEMRHCAYRFSKNIQAGKAVCLSVSEPKMTLLVTKKPGPSWKLTDARGFANKYVRKTVRSKIAQMIDDAFNKGNKTLDMSFLQHLNKVFIEKSVAGNR